MPPDNIVEANITWETSEGLAVPTKNGFPQGIAAKEKGEQESAHAQDKLANNPPLVFPTSPDNSSPASEFLTCPPFPLVLPCPSS